MRATRSGHRLLIEYSEGATDAGPGSLALVLAFPLGLAAGILADSMLLGPAALLSRPGIPLAVATAFAALVGLFLLWRLHRGYRRLDLEPDGVRLHPSLGFVRRAGTASLPTCVRLACREEEERGGKGWSWSVRLEPAPQPELAWKLHAELEMRAVAEAVAKHYRVPLIVSNPEEPDREVRIAPEDLDLPFAQRAKKYPALVGDPEGLPDLVSVESAAGRTVYRWGALNRRTVVLATVLPVALLLSKASPDLFRAFGFPGAIVVLAGLFAVEILVLALLGRRLDVDALEVRSTAVFGVGVWSRAIPLAELEDIRAHAGAVEMISDRAMIQCPFHDDERLQSARRVAAHLRRRIAGRA